MKQTFSTKWKASTQRRKQRKYGYNAPHHLRQKCLGASLSKGLREKQGRKTLSVKAGDKVKVMRGQFKGRSGKVDHVNLKQQKVFVEKMELIKKDGNKVMIPIDPSNVQIIELSEDKRRNKKNVSAKVTKVTPAPEKTKDDKQTKEATK
ncbi:MAG: 50S ribosomal protein L24 [DPANN group archaeon]|nr:50S ribosomal protein L24 [DPANN group archaeon]